MLAPFVCYLGVLILRNALRYGLTNSGLIVVGPLSSMQRYRNLVVDLAARYRFPAVYAGAAYAGTSALMSYGVDWIEQYRRAASYVDRILKGERPADLPVQAPTKYALVINLKTAKALGLTVPQSLLAGRRGD